MENVAMIVGGFILFVALWTTVDYVICAIRERGARKIDAIRRAEREARFRKEMGIVEDPDYVSPTSEDDRQWAERGVSRRR